MGRVPGKTREVYYPACGDDRVSRAVRHGISGSSGPRDRSIETEGFAMSTALMQDIGRLIGTWQPRKTYHIGPNFLEDLKKYLQNQMKPTSFSAGRRISLEVVDARGMGIGVKRKTVNQVETVGIVMKRDLADLMDLRLVMDQVDQAAKDYPELFVILMGNLVPDLEAKLAAFLANRGAVAKITVVKK